MKYDDLINRMNSLFRSRDLHYDAFYFFWTSLCMVMFSGDDLIDVEGPLRRVMRRYLDDEGYIDDIIRPVIRHDHSLESFEKYTRFGHDFYDLGSLWQNMILDRDHTAIERTIELLTGFKAILKEVRQEVLQAIGEEHVKFQKTFYDHYVIKNNKLFKEYTKKLSWSIHTMMIAAELLEVLK